MHATNTKQEKELSSLKENAELQQRKVTDDSVKLDNLEMYGRRQNLELEGIPSQPSENINITIMDLTKSVGIELKNSDISIAHRLPQKIHRNKTTTRKPPTVIVRFTNRSVRNNVYRRRTAFKAITKFPVNGMHQLFINENLTQPRKELFRRTK